jgi:RND family efflux transporter MFP subunit
MSRLPYSPTNAFVSAVFASVVITSTLATSGCRREAPTTPEVARPVKTMVVTGGEDSHVRSFPGTVEASRRVELAFQVSGLLVKFPVKEGQTVAKGDLIGQLRTDEFQARLTALQGQLDRARAALAALRAGERPEERLRREAAARAAEARLTNARADLDRARQLVQGRTISRQEFDRTEASYRVAKEELQSAVQLRDKGTVGREEDVQAAEAEVRGLEGRVVEANLQLADCSLRAPYNGVIARRFVEEGQNIRVAEPIVRFQDVDEVEIKVDVPETVMAVDIRTADILQLVAELSGAPGLEFPVTIREIAQVADPTTQTFNVRVAMQAPPGIQALPGMTATVTATYRRAGILGDRILAPVSAVSKQSAPQPADSKQPVAAQSVWVIGADNKVTRRPVKVGSLLGGQIEILDGLQIGDRIAVAGVSSLREGMAVSDLGDALGGGDGLGGGSR